MNANSYIGSTQLYCFTVTPYSFIRCYVGPPRLWNLEKYSILLVYQVHFFPTRLRVFYQNPHLLVYQVSSFIRHLRVLTYFCKPEYLTLATQYVHFPFLPAAQRCESHCVSTQLAYCNSLKEYLSSEKPCPSAHQYVQRTIHQRKIATSCDVWINLYDCLTDHIKEFISLFM